MNLEYTDKTIRKTGSYIKTNPTWEEESRIRFKTIERSKKDSLIGRHLIYRSSEVNKHFSYEKNCLVI